MGNEDLTGCILYYNLPEIKCVDVPKDGKAKRRQGKEEATIKKKKGKIMIDDKEIDIAARAQVLSKHVNETSYFQLRSIEDFKDGAKWALEQFLKDMWHPNTEEPDKSKSDIITLGFDNDAYLQFKESILWSEESWRHSISRCQITKWAYLSDILPKEGGKG